MGKKLYVGNLSFKASEEELRVLFSQAGQVESVKIITDRETGQSRGFAFIEMTSNEEASKAVTMFDGKPFLQRELKVNEAKPQPKRDERGGGGGGGGGGGYGRGGGGRGGWR